MKTISGKKAIIIGGGISGLSTAIALRSMGIDAAVFERSNELREVGAGLVIVVKRNEEPGEAGAVRCGMGSERTD